MQDWLPIADDYLEILVQHKGYSGDRLCQKGCDREGNWRCLDCFSKPLSCTECCRSEHSRHPFHRVEGWCGQYFAPSLLSASGVVLHLGHGGQPCPNALRPRDDTWVNDPDDSAEEDIDDPSLANPTVPPAFNDILSSLGHRNKQSHGKKHYDAHGNPLMTIVDWSGVHCLAIQPCCCHDHPPIHHQLLQIGLYPPIQTSSRTAFIFTVLDDFRLMNLECKLFANGFFSYLHCVTDPLFPHTQSVSETISPKHLLNTFSSKTSIVN